MEFKIRLQLSLGIEEYDYGGETEYSFYPEVGAALGLGFRF